MFHTKRDDVLCVCECSLNLQKGLIFPLPYLDLLFCEAAAIMSGRIQCIERDRVHWSVCTFDTNISNIFIIRLLLKRGWLGQFYFIIFCFIVIYHFCLVFLFRVPLLHRQLPKVHGVFSRSVLLNTQHKYLYMQTHSELINSVCPPSSPISLIHTDTHAHKVFAICMYQYEKSTQARKRKAELDYLGSLWHEKPSDKFLPPAALVEKRK